jgi:hypothetical protein
MSITAKLNRVAPKAPKAPPAPAPAAKTVKAAKPAPKAAKPVAKAAKAKAAKVQHTREAAPKASRSTGSYQATILVRNADGQTKSMTVSGLEANSLEAALALAPRALQSHFKASK